MLLYSLFFSDLGTFDNQKYQSEIRQVYKLGGDKIGTLFQAVCLAALSALVAPRDIVSVSLVWAGQ